MKNHNSLPRSIKGITLGLCLVWSFKIFEHIQVASNKDNSRAPISNKNVTKKERIPLTPCAPQLHSSQAWLSCSRSWLLLLNFQDTKVSWPVILPLCWHVNVFSGRVHTAPLTLTHLAREFPSDAVTSIRLTVATRTMAMLWRCLALKASIAIARLALGLVVSRCRRGFDREEDEKTKGDGSLVAVELERIHKAWS